jgi:aminopeptidase N
MTKLYCLFLLLLSCTGTVCGQEYASRGNELYWKNRKPHAAYWQQDVAYDIDARIDETTHQINASEELVYTNNSPDTLYYVFFHLFQNAFIKGAYTHRLEAANHTRPRLGQYEARGLGITVEELKADGKAVTTELDNTILKVYLPHPLLPGNKVTFSMRFNTYFDRGGTRRRMQMYDAWGFMHYNGCQWFPKISVYDAKFGWDTHQHLGKEFYGDFGSYKVSLDFASNYIVEATGMLQNREEVLPKALREKLDLKNFARKPWNEKPSEIIPYQKGERKKWIFYGENIHDFAFTADPSYRLGTAYWNGIECVAIAQEPHASGWQNGAALVAEIIKTFSLNYGMYHYPKMVAADANDGMEYPMITMDGGREPGYRGLLVHEIAHNWFYGMVGSNETYRAALDEGFTQFLTADGLIRIDGEIFKEDEPKGWRKKFYEPRLAKDVRVFNVYINDAATGNDHQLNTHSDDFNSALGHGGGYRLVYYKTAAMLYNLQYVLGDSLFQNAMKHYVNQWKFAHPYFEDFRNSIIGYTKVDLNWFFDQWIETTKNIDYSITGISKVKGTDSFDIRFRRKGEMQMPLDFTVISPQGGKQSYTIPNTWFAKESGAAVLPRWIGWGKLNKRYTARIAAPEGIKWVMTDTTYRLADKMMLDNYRGRNPLLCSPQVIVKLDGGTAPATDWKHYRLYVRPDLWYNAIDGVKAGVHLEGSYLGSFMKIDATAWLNTQLGQWDTYKDLGRESGARKWLNYTLNLETPLSLSLPQVTTFFNSRFLDGLWYHRAGAVWQIGDKNTFAAWGQTFQRNKGYTDYLLYPEEWSSNEDRINTSLNLSYTRSYNYSKGWGYLSLRARAPVFSNSFNYNYAELELTHNHVLHRLLVRSRLFGRYGSGNNIPYESALFLAGASPETMMDNKYVRSMAFIPTAWTGYSPYETNHLHYGGGLNMRGYAGYYAFDKRDGSQYTAYKGRSGAALNLEADFTNYIRWQPAFTRNWLSVNLYAFADAGIMELSSYYTSPPGQAFYTITTPVGKLSDLRVDAGLGAAVTIKKWGPFEKARPLTLRLDMPFFLNRPPYGDPQYFGARWLVGVSRAF